MIALDNKSENGVIPLKTSYTLNSVEDMSIYAESLFLNRMHTSLCLFGISSNVFITFLSLLSHRVGFCMILIRLIDSFIDLSYRFLFREMILFDNSTIG